MPVPTRERMTATAPIIDRRPGAGVRSAADVTKVPGAAEDTLHGDARASMQSFRYWGCKGSDQDFTDPIVFAEG
jgi:hypothetical protein